jgi:ribonuclease HII
VQKANFLLEGRIWRKGLKTVAGVDEVGRGAWAGPLLAAAVVFPPRVKLPLPLYDSKLISPKRREELAVFIKDEAEAFSFGEADPSFIERYGVTLATEKAMLAALEGLTIPPDFALVDFFTIGNYPRDKQQAVPKGDRLSASIAAASILAKVRRDRMMEAFCHRYPGYHFSSHKGYGTQKHQMALKRLGHTPIHRRSFISGYV